MQAPRSTGFQPEFRLGAVSALLQDFCVCGKHRIVRERPHFETGARLAIPLSSAPFYLIERAARTYADSKPCAAILLLNLVPLP